jgi:signal transduction histidine kinase
LKSYLIALILSHLILRFEKYQTAWQVMRPILTRVTACVVFSVIFVRLAVAQGITDFEPWRLVEFTPETGLLTSATYQRDAEVSSGIFWLRGDEGLYWFDGYRWQHPTILPDLAMGEHIGDSTLEGSTMLRVFPDIYVGGKSGIRRLPLNNVFQACQIGPHKVLALADSILEVYDDGTIYPFDRSPAEHGRCINVWHNEGGSIWVETERGLYRVDGGTWKLIIPSAHEPFHLINLVENSRHEVVAAIRTPYEVRGIWEWSGDSPPRKRNAHLDDVVKCIDLDDSGRVIVAYRSGDVEYREDGNWRLLQGFSHRFPEINQLAFRPNGDLVIVTSATTYLCRTSLARWTYVRHEPRGPWDRVNEILLTGSKSLWTATAAGVEFRTPAGVTKSFPSINGVDLHEITGLAEDSSGGIWISSGSTITGAYRWDGSTWTHFNVSNDSAAIHIHRIQKDRDGNLWFLGIPSSWVAAEGNSVSDREGPGAYVLRHGSFEHWGVERGLLSGRVYAFGEASDGTFWFGTHNGLSRYQNGSWQYWTAANGMGTRGVFSLAIDRDDHVWTADRSEQLGFFGGDLRRKTVTVEEGLPGGDVWDIAADDSGEVWVGTSSGISCYSNGNWTTYDQSSGLSKNEVWPVVAYGNDIYAGTAGEGVAILHRTRNTPPPIIIADGAIAQERQALIAWKAFAFGCEISPTDVLTRSRLDGGQWSIWSNHHQWTADGLLGGKHRLQIEAKGAEGNVSLPLDVAFAIPPPFYLRESFTIPVYGSLIILVCVGAYYQFRKRTLDKTLDRTIDSLEASRKEILELGRELTATEERERLRVSSYLHDSVLQSLNFVKLGIQMVNAEIKTPAEKATLEKALNQLEQAMADTQSVTFELTPKVLEGDDFAQAIEWLGERLEREHGRRIQVTAEQREYNIPRPSRTLLFRGARELILNSLKHSKALTIHVAMKVVERQIILTVADDGVGYSVESIVHEADKPGRMGLFQLRERLAYFGGRLETDSAPGKGTRSSIILPLDGTKPLSGII